MAHQKKMESPDRHEHDYKQTPATAFHLAQIFIVSFSLFRRAFQHRSDDRLGICVEHIFKNGQYLTDVRSAGGVVTAVGVLVPKRIF